QLTGGVQGLLKANKVEIVRGEAYFSGENTLRVINDDSAQTYSFKNAIIATGSRPIEIPAFPYSDRVLNSTGALAIKEIPKKLVVIGGRYIGTELGTAYANLGTELVILEGTKDILGGFESDMTSIVKRNLKNKGTEIVTNAMAKGVEEKED